VIPLGQATPERTVVFDGIVSDPDFPDHLRLEVEVRPVGVAFTGTPIGSSVLTTNGNRALVSIPGLDDDTEYHWQARVVDQDMNSSEWTQFGGNPETEADFKIAVPSVPFVPASLAQLRADGTTAISVGETIEEATVVYRATVSDPDPGDLLRLQTETRPIGVPFTGFPTDSSTQSSGGGPVSVTVSGLPDDVSYHWCARVTDQVGNESAWVSFGDNADVDVDFAVAVPASTLGFTTQPSAVRYGATFQPPIATTALEPSGATDTSFTGQVTIAIAPNTGTPGAVLSGTTVQNVVLGVTTFDDLSIDLVGSGYVLTATSPGLPSASSLAFDVLPGSAGRLAVVVQPSASAQSGVTLTQQPAAQVQDSDGHDVSDSGLTVTAEIASGPAGATLSSATSVTNSSGVANFDGLAIIGRVGDYVLRFTNPGLLPHISETVTLNPGLADPATTTAVVPDGAAGFTTTMVVTVRDVSGNALSGGGEVVAASVTGANVAAATVEDHGDSTYTATYTPTLAGTDSVAVTLAGQQITGSPYISVVTSTAASQITLYAGDDQTAVVGTAVPVPPAVLVTDEYGNGIAEVEVSFTVTSGAGRVNPTSPVVTNAEGVAQVHAWILGPISGANQLTATAASLAGSPVIFTATGTAGAVSPSQSTLAATPENLVADGSISTITVTARDANGNPISGATVSLAATGTGNTVTQPTGLTDSSGEATGTLSSTVAEVKTVSATVAGTTISQRATVVMTAGAASQLGITAQPSSVQSGLPFSQQPVIEVQDAHGNSVSQSGIVVTASLATGGGTLSGTVTATTDSTGLAMFTDLALTGVVGDRTLRFDAAGLTGVTSNTIAVMAGVASQLTILGQPSATVQSGFPFAEQPVIGLRDASGNGVSQAGVVVTAALATGEGTLGGTVTVATDSSGVATFADLSILGVVGARTMQFAATGLTPVVSNTITVMAGDASRLTIATQPSPSARSGQPFSQQPVIQLQDASGNSVNQSGVVVTASIVMGGGTLGGTLTAATDAGGVATFTDLSITGVAGDRTLWFEAPGFSAVISDTITVTGGSASELSVATQPSATVQSGIVFPQQPVIQLLDAAGNSANDAGVDVTVSLASGGGSLGGTLTVPTDAAGVATFTDLWLTGLVGERTLRFDAAGLASVTSGPISVIAGNASRLSITTQPAESAQSGFEFPEQPVIELQDASGNHVSLPGVIVTASIATGGGTLGGTVAATTDSGGVATFTDLSIMGVVGERTLQFAAAGLTGVTSAPITLTAGVASQLAIATQPSASAQNGVAFARQPVIQLRDASGNDAAESGVVVAASIATGGGALGGTVTATTGPDGRATFADLSLTGVVGDRTLQFDAAGLAAAISNTVTVTAGFASQLSMATQPSESAQNGVPFAQQPVIQLEDTSGNSANQSGVAVTASVASGGGKLGGTLTVTTTDGVAEFTNLSLAGVEGDYTLRFSADGLTSVTSTKIKLTAGAATQLGITTQPPAFAQSGMNFSAQPAVQLLDAGGNVVKQNKVGVTASIATGEGTLGGTLTVDTDKKGVAKFKNLSITGEPGDYTLRFSAPGLTAVTSTTVTLTAEPAAGPPQSALASSVAAGASLLVGQKP
jgi:adhesin/invasin